MSMKVTIGDKVIETKANNIGESVVTTNGSGYPPDVITQEPLLGVIEGADPSLMGLTTSSINGIFSPLTEAIFESVGGGVKAFLLAIIDGLNSISVEIITLTIITTAFGMILAPMINGKSGVWMGRCLLVTLVGSIWRLAI